MVEGGMKCVKYLLFAFNLIFFLAGLGLIIAGALVQTKFNAYFDFFGGQFSAAAILLIVVGGIIFIIGFFGCCGAYKENYCMVMTFAVLLGLIFILEIAAGITAYVLRDKVRGLAEEKLKEALVNYNVTGHEGVTDLWVQSQTDTQSLVLEHLNTAITQYDSDHQGVKDAWDSAQQEFECCGVNNYTDWSGQGSIPAGQVPASCCKPDMDCAANPTVQNTYQNGCMMEFTNWIEDNIFIIGGVGIGLAFVQLLGIILAVCLGRSIKKEYEVV